ncbi:MAG: hypothetical protein ABIQ88_20240 [Chitinophagaceae bacterium]
MKNKFAILLTTILFSLLAITAESQNLSTVIKVQAMEMARAVLAKDVEKLVLYMPPKLVADGGGKEKMLVARDSLNKYMKQFGAEIKKVTIGDPGKIITYKNQLQATVPQTTEVKFMAAKVIIESTLIAVSEDKGLHWYFVDTSIYRGEKIKSSLPDLSPELVVPPMKQPKIVADE